MSQKDRPKDRRWLWKRRAALLQFEKTTKFSNGASPLQLATQTTHNARLLEEVLEDLGLLVMEMADTRDDESPSDITFFRVLDLRARRRETRGERLRPYCVLRLGDKHHRTRTFPPEGFDPVHARRTTVDDRKLAGRAAVPRRELT